MTTLYLIRHGTTNSNLAGVFQGSMDVPLNERGLSQAALLARRFEKVHLDKIYVSALQRARQTGEALAKGRGLEVQVMPLLNEIDLGEMEGHTGQECRQLFPQAVQDLEENTAWFQAPGGDVYKRQAGYIPVDGSDHKLFLLADLQRFVIHRGKYYIDTGTGGAGLRGKIAVEQIDPRV